MFSLGPAQLAAQALDDGFTALVLDLKHTRGKNLKQVYGRNMGNLTFMTSQRTNIR